MEDKKIKSISLGTSVYIFIIMLLIVALGVVYYLGFVKNNQEILALKDEINVLKTQYTNNVEDSNKQNNKEKTYKELTDNLGQNELFGLININKNTDGTYTLYGGIYEKIDSRSAKLSNEAYKKVIVQGHTKYVDYYDNEITIKEIYDQYNFPREDNELESTIYANSTWLLKFEFSKEKCILIEEINLAT